MRQRLWIYLEAARIGADLGVSKMSDSDFGRQTARSRAISTQAAQGHQARSVTYPRMLLQLAVAAVMFAALIEIVAAFG